MQNVRGSAGQTRKKLKKCTLFFYPNMGTLRNRCRRHEVYLYLDKKIVCTFSTFCLFDQPNPGQNLKCPGLGWSNRKKVEKVHTIFILALRPSASRRPPPTGFQPTTMRS